MITLTNEEYGAELKSLNRKISHAASMIRKANGDQCVYDRYLFSRNKLIEKRNALAKDFYTELQKYSTEAFDEILGSKEKKFVLENILVKQKDDNGTCYYSRAFNLTKFRDSYINKWDSIYTICKSPDDFNIYRGESIITHGKILINVNNMFVDYDPDDGLAITDCLPEIMLIFAFFYHDNKDVYTSAIETKKFFENKILTTHEPLVKLCLQDELKLSGLLLLKQLIWIT